MTTSAFDVTRSIDVTDSIDAKVLLGVLAQVDGGDFTARMPLDWTGVAGKVADSFNDVIIANQAAPRTPGRAAATR